MENKEEKKIAADIMNIVRKLGLPLKLDKITEGRGNCFPLAVIAQCNRQEIYNELSWQHQAVIKKDCSLLLRQEVKKFMMNSATKIVKDFRCRYDEVVAPIDGNDWHQYWKKMSQNYEWVDSTFVQGAAWYLNHDIIIVTTSGREEDPFIRISGNHFNTDIECNNTPLIVGCKSDVHYQSLLPIDVGMENIKEAVKAQAEYDENYPPLISSAKNLLTCIIPMQAVK